jgi:hypothetical protein
MRTGAGFGLRVSAPKARRQRSLGACRTYRAAVKSFEGKGLVNPGIRALFTRENMLAAIGMPG